MSPSRLRAPVIAALCLLLAGCLAACGNQQPIRTQADTEGPYLDVGALKYQVQVSRQLNPADIEDQVYLRGVAPADSRLRPDETWFAVFVRAVNDGDRAEPAAPSFEILDTQGRRFSPVPIRFVLPCLSTWMPPTKNLSAKKYLFVERQQPVFS